MKEQEWFKIFLQTQQKAGSAGSAGSSEEKNPFEDWMNKR